MGIRPSIADHLQLIAGAAPQPPTSPTAARGFTPAAISAWHELAIASDSAAAFGNRQRRTTLPTGGADLAYNESDNRTNSGLVLDLSGFRVYQDLLWISQSVGCVS